MSVHSGEAGPMEVVMFHGPMFDALPSECSRPLATPMPCHGFRRGCPAGAAKSLAELGVYSNRESIPSSAPSSKGT